MVIVRNAMRIRRNRAHPGNCLVVMTAATKSAGAQTQYRDVEKSASRLPHKQEVVGAEPTVATICLLAHSGDCPAPRRAFF